jgi:hypothetical protein
MSFSEITTRLPIYLTKVGEKAFVFAVGRLRESFDANLLLLKEKYHDHLIVLNQGMNSIICRMKNSRVMIFFDIKDITFILASNCYHHSLERISLAHYVFHQQKEISWIVKQR